uniref:inositol oxygenase n=2 Tax=Solanum tuberosum TaxID=4113 RepID=M0ZPB2_SOLTU
MLMALFCRSIVSNFPLPRLPLQLVPLNTTPFPHCPSKSYQITALPLVLRCKTASFASLPSSPPPPSSTMENPPEGYRRNVGICLMNPSNKKIFAASRLDIPSAWQMPQGGVDDNEDPTNAAIRELREETGVTSAEIVAEVPHWVTYDFPPDVREKLRHQWGSDWKGQAQKWFLFKFTGKDEEINLLGDGTEKAEFGEWSWISPEQVIELTFEVCPKTTYGFNSYYFDFYPKILSTGSGFQEARLQGSSICFLATFPVVKLVISEVRSSRGVEVDSKKENSDGVFVVPGNNAFGNSFRDYSAETERQKIVRELYHQSHINQTYDFVKKMREEYGKVNKVEMSIWECCELLNEVVDDSDPDLDEPQIEHLLQTAEAIRKDYPNEDWLHLTGLIHDLGKVLLLPSFGGLPQWAVVGDTFPLGCAFDESIVLHEQLKGNPDNNNPTYNTKYGVYSEGCGLNNVVMSWGHDDYMYLVAKANKTTLPSAALFIIRYHSFYPLHKSGAYTHLMNEEDHENLKWLQIFSKYDLYSKSNVRIDVEKVKPYYMSLIEKYFPAKLKW